MRFSSPHLFLCLLENKNGSDATKKNSENRSKQIITLYLFFSQYSLLVMWNLISLVKLVLNFVADTTANV